MKLKYIKTINCPVREEMYNKVLEICEEKDIPSSVFVREAIKLYLEKESKDGK